MKAVFIRLPSHWGDLIGLKMKQIILEELLEAVTKEIGGHHVTFSVT